MQSTSSLWFGIIGLLASSGHGAVQFLPAREVPLACTDFAAGAPCTFTMTGICRHVPGDGPIACDFPPPAPSREAVESCSGLAEGMACEFTVEGITRTGTCKGPKEMPLACVEPLPVPPREVLEACATKAEGDVCTLWAASHCAGEGGSPLTCAPPPPGASGAMTVSAKAGGPHTMSGTCIAIRKGPRACAPLFLVRACAHLGPGAACNFRGMDGRSVSGTCLGLDNEHLACVDERGLPPAPPEAVAACTEPAAEGDDCSFRL